MALTNAEKQKQFRENHAGLVDGFETLHRLQTNLNSMAHRNLERMVIATGKTKRELIEQALVELSDRLECRYPDQANYTEL